MRSLSFILLIFSVAAQAQQWGTGIFPGTQCPGQFQPAGQAFNSRDNLTNAIGQLAARNKSIQDLKDREKVLDGRIDRAISYMKPILTDKGIDAIREHREHHNDRASYSMRCGGKSEGQSNPSASGGSQYADRELFSTSKGTRQSNSTETQRPPPAVFCATNPDTGKKENLWDRFAESKGTVCEDICDHYIPNATKGRFPDKQDECHEGLHDYYTYMNERENLVREIKDLNDEARKLERRIDHIPEEGEAGYCAACAQRRGYSNQGVSNSMAEGFKILLNFGGNQQRPMFGSPQMGFGGGGYPQAPYAAQMPGYYGIGPGGTYGAVPGGIGQGAFGCQGTSPFASSPILGNMLGPLNNQWAQQRPPFVFNPGAGPWGYPQYGNGVPGYRNGPPGPFPYNFGYGNFGVPNLGSQYPWGSSYGSFYSQLNQFSNRMQLIQNGSGFSSGSPPVILPYNGPPAVGGAPGLPPPNIVPIH